jgi:hypothetical protein
MTAEVVSIFDHPRMRKPQTITADEARSRWINASKCGDTDASLRAQIDCFAALFGYFPEKPCDTE